MRARVIARAKVESGERECDKGGHGARLSENERMAESKWSVGLLLHAGEAGSRQTGV